MMLHCAFGKSIAKNCRCPFGILDDHDTSVTFVAQQLNQLPIVFFKQDNFNFPLALFNFTVGIKNLGQDNDFIRNSSQISATN
ncbi:MAG: hypothetical protein ABL933_11055 [Methyloglobulus sp.]